ncbi:MAG: hypothetical protein U9Q05_07950 [Thermodesulfobacteriota bacterium]|nr:hypothetical protein [Thermodesulfobacteriota bacterium]
MDLKSDGVVKSPICGVFERCMVFDFRAAEKIKSGVIPVDFISSEALKSH